MRNIKIKRNILLNPGPATTTDTVKYAQVVPDICHRELEFQKIMQQIQCDLVKIAQGDENYTSILFAGSGTAVMDAVINSVIPPKKKVLIVNNGAYGQRMVNIAKVYRIKFKEIKSSGYEALSLEEIEKVISQDQDIACIAMVHHETTTGVLNPARQVGELANKYNLVFILDAMSSFAGIPFDIKEFKIDYLLSTSNKCIQGMPGLSFIICKIESLEKIAKYPRRSFYLSLYDQYLYFEKNHQMRFTPPVQTIYALKQAIQELFTESMQNRYRRYTQCWQLLREGLQEIGFKLLLPIELESRILLTVIEPSNHKYSFNKMHDLLYEKGFTIYPGKVSSNNSFRVANIGAINTNDIKKFLIEMKKPLKQMGLGTKRDQLYKKN